MNFEVVSKKSVSFFILFFVSISIFLTLYLLGQKQEIREKAAVPGGPARVYMLPGFGTYEVNQAFPVNIYFNTAGIAISAITARIYYPYNEQVPILNLSSIGYFKFFCQSNSPY